MLNGKLIHPQIMSALAMCGHGDKILIADGNYPLASKTQGAQTVYLGLKPGQPTVTDVLDAILSAANVEKAEVMDPADGTTPEIFGEFQAMLGGMEQKPSRLVIGGVALDDETKTVTVDGDAVSLTPMEYNILHLLMQHPGRVYSSAQIYGLVWNETAMGSESAVAVHIRHLREKIEINPSEPRYLKVVWGLGYKMEAPGTTAR